MLNKSRQTYAHVTHEAKHVFGLQGIINTRSLLSKTGERKAAKETKGENIFVKLYR